MSPNYHLFFISSFGCLFVAKSNLTRGSVKFSKEELEETIVQIKGPIHNGKYNQTVKALEVPRGHSDPPLHPSRRTRCHHSHFSQT